MKCITKKDEPLSLKTHRSTPGADFNSAPKNDIRLNLIAEQRGICAYCMRRISNEWDKSLNKYKTEIEHYYSQDVYNGTHDKPDLRLNYNNMLGVCNGNSGNPKHKLHCDKSKDFKEHKTFLPLTINPIDPNCNVNLIKYRNNGEIYSGDTQVNRELHKVLNLNEEMLVKNRQTAINFEIKTINTASKGKTTSWSKSQILKEKTKWESLNKDNKYKEYCQAVVCILEKYLSRL